MYPTSENNRPVSFSLRVLQKNSLSSNVLLLIGLLLIWPGIRWLRIRSHEADRWSQSDYGPQE